MMHQRLGILVTHPIQYYVPWYRALAALCDLQVFFCQAQSQAGQAAAGFGVAFDWDIPLLDGYPHRFLPNRAPVPDVSTFSGCDTPEIGALIRQERFDAFLVQGWYAKSHWQAMLACWQTGTPLMVRGDSQLTTPRSPIKRLAKELGYRAFIPRFDGYLLVGERSRAYYLHYGADPANMFFVPHAVDNAFFASRSAAQRLERKALRARWEIPEDAQVALFAGKFISKKRPDDFCAAVAQAAQERPGVWGLLVGDGPMRAELEAEAQQRNLPLRFAGFLNQTEMPAAYAASDLLVLPSDGGETWGLVVNEAMASGLPAVVSEAVGCTPDLIVPDETGASYPCGDVAALARILSRLTESPTHLQAMGQRAQRHIERYSISHAARGTLEAVNALARSPRAAVVQPIPEEEARP